MKLGADLSVVKAKRTKAAAAAAPLCFPHDAKGGVMRSRYDDVALPSFFLHQQHLCLPSSHASFLSHLPSQADISFLSESNNVYSSSRTGWNK